MIEYPKRKYEADGGASYVVLVVYAHLRSAHSRRHAVRRKNDVETLSPKDQSLDGIQNDALHEEHGYMEICSRLLRTSLVESRLHHACAVCPDPYSILSQQ